MKRSIKDILLLGLPFFGWLLAMNVLVFLPMYFAHPGRAHFLPFSGMHLDQHGWSGLVLINDNFNPFRINGELTLLAGLLLLTWNSLLLRRFFKALLFLALPVVLCYSIYQQIYFRLYSIHPNFLDDWITVREVLPVFLSSIELAEAGYVLLLVLGIALLGVLLFFLLRWGLQAIPRGRQTPWTARVLLLLFAFIAWGTIKYRNLPHTDFRGTIQWATPRIMESAKVTNPFHAEYSEIQEAYGRFPACDWEERPNVYLIFAEAYGAAAYLGLEQGPALRRLAGALTDTLQQYGWHAASTYSRAPVMGGRSWLSFSTGLSGAEISSHRSYKGLLAAGFEYPHLIRFFRDKGYHTTWISTMQTNEKTDTYISEDTLNAFWGYDTLLFYNKIPYTGFQYDPFGGMPDQYAISYYHHQIRPLHPRSPHFVFFITTGTHSPFYDPPPILRDWTALNAFRPDNAGTYWELRGDYPHRYSRSVEYILQMWTRFILQEGKPNDVFLIVGDHQAAGLEYLLNGKYDPYATPFHLITRDTALARAFLDQGLLPGLDIDPEQAHYITHASLYSRIVKGLSDRYGTGKACRGIQVRAEGITVGGRAGVD